MKKVIKIISIFLVVGLIAGTLGMFAKLTNNFKNNNKTSIEKNWKDLIKKNNNPAEKIEIKYKPKLSGLNVELKDFISQDIKKDTYKLINAKKINIYEVQSSNENVKMDYTFYTLENINFNSCEYVQYCYNITSIGGYILNILVNKTNGNKYLMLNYVIDGSSQKNILIKINNDINDSLFNKEVYTINFVNSEKHIVSVENHEYFWFEKSISF